MVSCSLVQQKNRKNNNIWKNKTTIKYDRIKKQHQHQKPSKVSVDKNCSMSSYSTTNSWSKFPSWCDPCLDIGYFPHGYSACRSYG